MQRCLMKGVLFLIVLSGLVLAHEGHHPRPEEPVSPKLIGFFEKRLADNPADTIALSKLGGLYLKKARMSALHRDYRASEDHFRALLVIDSEDTVGLEGLGYALVGQHRFREALEYARKVGERNANEPRMWALIGDIHFALGHYLEAEMFFSRLLQERETLGSLARMAQVSEARGDFSKSEDLLTRALEKGQSDEVPGHQRAWCRAMLGDLNTRLNRFEKAESFYREALAETPGADDIHWRFAELLLLTGRANEAAKRMKPLLARVTGKPQYAFTYGEVLLALDRKREAADWFGKGEALVATEIENADIGHLRELVKHRIRRGAQLEQAYGLALKDLTEVRQDSEAYELVAWLLYLNGRSAEAIPYLEKALAPGLTHTETLFRAGLVYYEPGRKLTALHLLRLGAERGGPVDPSLGRRAAETLDRLKKHPEELRAMFISKNEKIRAEPTSTAGRPVKER